MDWTLIDPFESLTRLRQGLPAVDVRSAGEFAQGYIPGFINGPILNDEQRHQVGWTYKHVGSEKAVTLGHQLVDPLRPTLVSEWRKVLPSSGTTAGMVACWRGGLRSEIAARWLAEAGVEGARIRGGYKALRALLLEQIEVAREWVVVGGLTGSGKSELLRALPAPYVLDLEDLAKHRGSAFGGFLHEPQPAQQTFENAIGLQLLGHTGVMVVENESSMIGRCAVPATIRSSIERSPLVRLWSSMEERVARVHNDYVAEPLRLHSSDTVKTSLLTSLARIAKALGGVRMARAAGQISAAFDRQDYSCAAHQPWIETLLKEYYDPMYEYGLKRDERKLLFEGEFHAVREFLTDFVDRRRS